MDGDGWEFLSDDGFIDLNEDHEKRIVLGKRDSDFKNFVDSDYILCPPPIAKNNDQVIPVSTQFDSVDFDFFKEISKNSSEVKAEQGTDSPVIPVSTQFDSLDYDFFKEISKKSSEVKAEQGTDSPVSFMKKKEIEEFVDMKMDLPIDTGALKFEEKEEDAMEIVVSPKLKAEKREETAMEIAPLSKLKTEKEMRISPNLKDDDNGGFSIWKWSFTGIGAICTFGVAAATICILCFGSQKIRFQIYSDHKDHTASGSGACIQIDH